MKRITRRRFMKAAAGVVVGGVGMVSYARWVEPHWVRWFHRELPIRNLPDALVGKTLVQASDLHVGPRVSDGYLMETFDRIGELEPDVFVVTGDFVTFRGPNRFEKLARVLEHTPRGRIATLGVLGNHDYGHHWEDATTAERVSERVTGAGFTLLRNETVDVMGLAVTGMDDLWARQIDVAGRWRGLVKRRDWCCVIIRRAWMSRGGRGTWDGCCRAIRMGGSASRRFFRRRCCRCVIGGMWRGRWDWRMDVGFISIGGWVICSRRDSMCGRR